MSLARKVQRHIQRKNRNRVTVDMGRSSIYRVPELLIPSHYASRPDISNPDIPIYGLDPPHILRALEDEHVAKEEGIPTPLQDEKLDDPLPHDGYRPPLTQFTVDCVRLRVLKVLVDNARDATEKGEPIDWGVKYLWFPEPCADHYQLRQGNPPPDSDRPKWLKGLRLELDLQNPRWALERARQFRGWDNALQMSKPEPRIWVPQ